MPVSYAQIEANRRNARFSTGPRTPQGKARSRANSYRHGLAGEGVVLPSEDLAEVDRLDAELQADLNPSGPMGRILVRRIAVSSARMERCVRHDFAATAERVRNAVAEFDDTRKAEAEYNLSWLASEPLTFARRLRESPEGLDLLIREWERLAADLVDPVRIEWYAGQADQAANLTGDRATCHHVTRWRALSRAMYNDRNLLGPGEGVGLELAELQVWAAGELARMIEAELADLRALRAEIDETTIALDRAGAPDRAQFDPSREATLARKYEAAAERAMYRALKELKEYEARAAAPDEPESPAPTGPTGAELGSSGNAAEARAARPAPAPRMPEPNPPVSPIGPVSYVHPFANVTGDGPMSVERGPG